MKKFKQIRISTSVFLLVFPMMVSCSAFNNGVSDDPAVVTQREYVEKLEAEVREAEREAEEAELRAKAAKSRLKAAEVELDVLISEVKRRNEQ